VSDRDLVIETSVLVSRLHETGILWSWSWALGTCFGFGFGLEG